MHKRFLLQRRFNTPLPTRRADKLASHRTRRRMTIFRRLLKPITRSALEWCQRRDRQLAQMSNEEFAREAERIRVNCEPQWVPSDPVYDATLHWRVVPMLIERLRSVSGQLVELEQRCERSELIRRTVQDALAHRPLEALLDSAVNVNCALLEGGEVPTFSKVLGVYYVRKNDEVLHDARSVLERREGDVDDLCAWRVASLRYSGEDLGARCEVIRHLHKYWTVKVRRSDGTLEDPALLFEPAEEKLRTVNFQLRVSRWMATAGIATDPPPKKERALRVLEEAVEYAQALGIEQSQSEALVAYVYERPSGVPAQELAGVLVASAAAATSLGEDFGELGEQELDRISTPERMARARRRDEEKRRAGVGRRD